MNTQSLSPDTLRLATGVAGLDDILGGGLPPNRVYLLQGRPGTGKSTLALQFLREGVRRGERVVYVSLSQTGQELQDIARSHGWDIAGVEIIEFPDEEGEARRRDGQTVFHTVDVDLIRFMDTLERRIREQDPDRVVLDSFTEVRLLAHDTLRYRQTLLDLKLFFSDLPATVLLLDDIPEQTGDYQLQNVCHGVIETARRTPLYGALSRQIEVIKLRGVDFLNGRHDMRLITGGLEVFPRLQLDGEADVPPDGLLPSGLAHLDAMLDGGLTFNTSTLLLGPSGVGKSTLATLFAVAAARCGQRAAVFLFEESIGSFMARADALGLDLSAQRAAGRVSLRHVNVTELSPGQLTQTIRRTVAEEQARVVVIDSLTGYLNALPQENLLLAQLHELIIYLNQRQVLTLLVMAQHGLLGDDTQSAVDVSYIADTILLLRHVEDRGRLTKTLAVVKKRHGRHSPDLAHLDLSQGQIIAQPLSSDLMAAHYHQHEGRPGQEAPASPSN